MAGSNPWPTIHAERKALAAELESVPSDQWSTLSLCEGWSVQQVLGHMTATAKMTPPKFMTKMLGSGFRFNAMVAKAVAEEATGTPAEVLARFKEQVDASTHPPGPVDAMLGEVIVHGEDIRRPLGISHEYPAAALGQVADFYGSSNLLIGGKKRIAGLRLKATDTDWSTGSGPEVTGPAISLVMAIAGRKASLDDLSGEGLSVLTGRL